VKRKKPCSLTYERLRLRLSQFALSRIHQSIWLSLYQDMLVVVRIRAVIIRCTCLLFFLLLNFMYKLYENMMNKRNNKFEEVTLWKYKFPWFTLVPRIFPLRSLSTSWIWVDLIFLVKRSAYFTTLPTMVWQTLALIILHIMLNLIHIIVRYSHRTV
jgi:hypothetical protein